MASSLKAFLKYSPMKASARWCMPTSTVKSGGEKKDAASIHRLSREAMAEELLVARSEEAIEEMLEDYFLFEIDDNPAACVACMRT